MRRLNVAWSEMTTNPNDFKTPGQLINHLLDARGWSQRVLAIVLDADESGINRLVADKRPVTAEMAVTLEELFNVPADTFMELQKRFDLGKAKLTARPDLGRSTRAQLFGGLPVTEMIKRGWLDAKDIKNVPEVEEALAKFFGVSSVEEIEILPHAAKKTQIAPSVTPVQLAWIYRVKSIADEMLVGKYSPEAVNIAISRLSALRAAPTETRKIPRMLAEAGIRYVIVESLTSAKIDGVSFWLNDRSPVIGMSLRFDRIDNFWFVLRHELEHIIRGHGKTEIVLDAELEGERAGVNDDLPEEERIANDAAAEFCVPKAQMELLIERKAPFFNQDDIVGFARTINVHPGLVAGQLQRRMGRYDRWRNFLVKVRSSITPSAYVDGWGDVAPIGI